MSIKTVCVDEARVPARASDQPGIGSNHPAIFHMRIYTVNVHLCYDSNVHRRRGAAGKTF